MRRSMLALLALILLPALVSAQTSGAPVTYTPPGGTSSVQASTPTRVTASAGAFTVNCTSTSFVIVTLGNGAHTATVTAPTADGTVCRVKVIQPPSGAAGTVTWPAAVHWPGAVAPVLTTTNAQYDFVSLVWDGTASTWTAGASLNYAP